MVLTFESLKEILEGEHPNESYSEKYFHVVLRFIMLYKVVLTFDSVEDLDLRVRTIKESYTEQLLSSLLFPVVKFIMLYKVVLEILKLS